MATGPAIRRITQGGRFPQRSVTAVHSRHVDPSVQTDAGPARARATIRGVVWLQALANGLGVIAVWAYFAFLLPGSEGGRMESSTINLVAFGTYTAVMVLLALPVNALLLRRAVSWVRLGNPPTEHQRRLLFTLPTVETLSALVTWIGAAVLFGVIAGLAVYAFLLSLYPMEIDWEPDADRPLETDEDRARKAEGA